MNPPESSPEITTGRQLGGQGVGSRLGGVWGRGKHGAGCDTWDLGRRAWAEAPGNVVVQALVNRHDRSMEAAHQEGSH